MRTISPVGADENLSTDLSSAVSQEDFPVTNRILSAVLTAAFIAATGVGPAVAQESTPVKKVSPQQQKMKDCAGKWKAEKAAKQVSGQAEYRKFMSACLKR